MNYFTLSTFTVFYNSKIYGRLGFHSKLGAGIALLAWAHVCVCVCSGGGRFSLAYMGSMSAAQTFPHWQMLSIITTH